MERSRHYFCNHWRDRGADNSKKIFATFFKEIFENLEKNPKNPKILKKSLKNPKNLWKIMKKIYKIIPKIPKILKKSQKSLEILIFVISFRVICPSSFSHLGKDPRGPFYLLENENMIIPGRKIYVARATWGFPGIFIFYFSFFSKYVHFLW